MSTAIINAGACGFKTTVKSENMGKYQCNLSIESQCPHVTKMAEALGTINAMDELFKKNQSQVIAACLQNLPHITCPVSVGILKAIEASAGLALPKDVSISVSK